MAAIKSNDENAGKSARSGNSATRGGCGDMRARNKIEFRKGGEGGWLDASKKRRYCVLPLSLSLSLSYLCSFDPGIFGRMKFGFEVNPLVRNQSRPHRITRVATENGFRDFKRVVELRFTEGNRTGEKGKGIWKMLDTLHTHGTNVYREIFRPPPPDKGEFHPRLSFGANATFHDENSIFQEIDVGNYFFSPSLFLSLYLSSYEDGNLVLGERASLPRRDWKSIMESYFYCWNLAAIVRLFYSILEYFILLKNIVLYIYIL